MLGITAMARQTRDRNAQTHRSLNRLEGTVHRQFRVTQDITTQPLTTQDTMTIRSSTFPMAQDRETDKVDRREGTAQAWV